MTPTKAVKLGIGAIAMVVTLCVVASWFSRKSARTEENAIVWRAYDPMMLANVGGDLDRDRPAGARRAEVDMTFRLRRSDEKLNDSTIVIRVYDSTGSHVIYRGPFREQISFGSVSYDDELVGVFFWAFHEKTMTFSVWNSEEAWPVFKGEPLDVDLYDAYDETVHGWFKMSRKIGVDQGSRRDDHREER